MRKRPLGLSNWYFRHNQQRQRFCSKRHRQPPHHRANEHQTGNAVVHRTTVLTILLRTRQSQPRQNFPTERETLKTSRLHLHRLWRPSKILLHKPRRQTFPCNRSGFIPYPRVRPLIDQQTPTVEDDVSLMSVFEAENLEMDEWFTSKP